MGAAIGLSACHTGHLGRESHAGSLQEYTGTGVMRSLPNVPTWSKSSSVSCTMSLLAVGNDVDSAKLANHHKANFQAKRMSV